MPVAQPKTMKKKPPTVKRPGIKLRVEKKLGLLGPINLECYRSHGTGNFLQIKGRVVEAHHDWGLNKLRNGIYYNILTTLQRFATDEIPGVTVNVQFQNNTYTTYTDKEGFFVLNLWSPDGPFEPGWHDLQVTAEGVYGEAGDVVDTASVMVPPNRAEVAVITDLDDTVIQSNATSRWRHWVKTLTHSASQRRPVDEMAPLLRRLTKPSEAGVKNPIFYLSNSGWNLYSMLQEFLEEHEFPRGPMFLKDLAFFESKSQTMGSAHHKLNRIRELMGTYMDLPFILIGDNGQTDPDYYWQITIENPGRVKAIYLNDVASGKSRARTLEILDDLRDRKIDVVHSTKPADFTRLLEARGLFAST